MHLNKLCRKKLDNIYAFNRVCNCMHYDIGNANIPIISTTMFKSHKYKIPNRLIQQNLSTTTHHFRRHTISDDTPFPSNYYLSHKYSNILFFVVSLIFLNSSNIKCLDVSPRGKSTGISN